MRDAYGIARGTSHLPAEVVASFVVVASGSLAWSWMASRLRKKAISSTGLHFLGGSLAVFWIAFQVFGTTLALANAFFVWGSTFNLIATSIFWSRIVDSYTENESHDRFPLIAVGGSIGAIVGPVLMMFLSPRVATHHLLLLSAALIEAGAWLLGRATGASAQISRAALPLDEQPLGGSWIAGLRLTLQSGQLCNLALYVVTTGVMATLVYVEQGRIVSAAVKSTGERARLFATIDLVTNLATATVQVLLASRIMRRIGAPKTIAAFPLAGAAAVSALAGRPSLGVLFAAQVLRRTVDYSLAGPAREVLFTTLSAQHKYKAKGFVDVVAPRFGDAVGAYADALTGGPPSRLVSLSWAFAAAALMSLRGVQRARAEALIEAHAGDHLPPAADSEPSLGS
jgi:AAA family ATP:ADP antiporter